MSDLGIFCSWQHLCTCLSFTESGQCIDEVDIRGFRIFPRYASTKETKAGRLYSVTNKNTSIKT